MNGTTIAVVVAVRNAKATVEDCLRSLCALDAGGHRIEIVVVDNGSTDGTLDIVGRFSDRVRLMSESKRGPAAARNRGIRESSAEIVAFTDSDCTVEREWLIELVKPLADESTGIVGGRILSAEPCNRIEKYGERIHDHRAAIEYYRPPYAITGNWASRREVLLEAGLFDEQLLRGSDAEMAFRIGSLGYRLVYQDSAIVRHRNERTFRGLFHEGVLHGRGRAGMHEKSPRLVRRWTTGRSLLRSCRNAVTGEEMPRFDSICSIVFNAGKLAGEVAASRRPK
jgi:glycosyltransferase involved in cell wall biosynthesis